jgi:ATP synthase protein I
VPIRIRGFILGEVPGVMLRVQSRPFRLVLGWQSVATLVAVMLAGYAAGLHGAVSAALGGAIGIAGGLAFAWMASRHRAHTADAVLVAALKAEAVKVLVFIALLALVLATYKHVVIVGLIGAFIVSTLISGFAFFVRDT